MQSKKTKKSESDKFITLLLLPEEASEGKAFKLSKKVIYAFSTVLSLLLTITMTTSFVLAQHGAKSLETVDRIQDELAQKLAENKLLSEKNAKSEKLVEAIESNFEQQLSDLEEKSGLLDEKIEELAELKQGLLSDFSKHPYSPANDFAQAKSAESEDLQTVFASHANPKEKLLHDLQEKGRLLDSFISDFKLLNEYSVLHKDFLKHYPSILPVAGQVSSDFGNRRDPIGRYVKEHKGIDIVTKHGSPIFSTANGKIEFAGSQSGYGNLVIVDHGYGFKTYYAHLSKLLVKAGDSVEKTDKIALSGNTGRSTGPHLHYEVRYLEELLDPSEFFAG